MVTHHQVGVRYPQLGEVGMEEKLFGTSEYMLYVASVNLNIFMNLCISLYMYLQSKSKVTALCVSDQTGSHGTVGAPAPLQITHGVLVQVACCHQRAA